MDFGSRPLNPTCCIGLVTSFDTFQQRPKFDPFAMARPVWVNEKILEILTQRDTSLI